MTGFNHAMTGAVIALTVKNPPVAVPLAFLSHFVQDAIPHWNYGVSREVDNKPTFFTKRFNYSLTVDFSGSIILMIILAVMFPAQKWIIWACMIAAASPDLMWAYYRLYKQHIQKQPLRLDLLARLHNRIQRSQTAKGIWVEICWFLLMGAIILNLQ